jgi:hypothetical protein
MSLVQAEARGEAEGGGQVDLGLVDDVFHGRQIRGWPRLTASAAAGMMPPADRMTGAT